MGKKKDIETDLPQGPEKRPAPLTPESQKVSSFVDSAASDPAFPEISDVRKIVEKVELEVPESIIKGPEYVYAWLSIANLERGSLISHGGKWEVVTRTNHPRVDTRLFDLNGAITYKGQNILAYTRRELKEAEEKIIIDDYNNKAKAAKETSINKEGVMLEEMDKNAVGRVVGEEALTSAEDYDYGPTQGDAE